MIGRIIAGRYEFVKYLGGGGMSNVYLAKDNILDRKVEVKVINIPPYEKEKTVSGSMDRDLRCLYALVALPGNQFYQESGYFQPRQRLLCGV